METNVIPLIAAVGGFGMTLVMGGKIAFDTFRTRASDGDVLALFINGKDYTVDLKTIGNGGSEKIHAALAELECID